MTNFCKFLTSASLFVLFASAFNLRSDDNNLVLPYDQTTMSAYDSIQPEDASVDAAAPQPSQSAPEIYGEQTTDASQMIPPPPPADSNDDRFFEVQLDATSFRAAKTSHTNLIVALTQQEQRNDSNQVSGGDINSGIMRDVEQGVLSNITQHFNAPNDPSKIAFIRLDVTKNAWVWSYFNDGTSSQSVDPKNGTPQYLFFNQGNLISVLIGNRDDSAFANWVRSNTTIDDNILPPQETTDIVDPDASMQDVQTQDAQMQDMQNAQAQDAEDAQMQDTLTPDQIDAANAMLAADTYQPAVDDSSQADDSSVNQDQMQQDQLQ